MGDSCWFCRGAPREGELCAKCKTGLSGFADYVRSFNGKSIVAVPPQHHKDCICEWCMAIKRAAKQKRWDAEAEANREVKDPTWRKSRRVLPPSPPTVRLERSEPPNEKSFVTVVTSQPAWDEVAAQRKKQKDKRQENHPSVYVSTGPSLDAVMAVAHLFSPVSGRPTPKTSGCWFCLDRPKDGDLCGMCEQLLEDYTRYLESRPAVDL